MSLFPKVFYAPNYPLVPASFYINWMLLVMAINLLNVSKPSSLMVFLRNGDIYYKTFYGRN